jgi:predicted MFS family arabinose efflux permease
MTGDMPREITPDDAHSIAPDIAGDDGVSAPATEGTVHRSVASVAFARGPNDATVLPPLDHTAIRTIIAGIMLAMFLSALEQTIVAPALPAIGKSLANLDDLSWVVTAYLIAATAATPLFGKLTDIHGRRTIMLLSIGIFIVGSLACALASSMWVLITGRVLQGIGGGGLIPIAQTIIADLLTPRERPIAQSYTSVVF